MTIGINRITGRAVSYKTAIKYGLENIKLFADTYIAPGRGEISKKTAQKYLAEGKQVFYNTDNTLFNQFTGRLVDNNSRNRKAIKDAIDKQNEIIKNAHQVSWNITIPIRFSYNVEGETRFTNWKIQRYDFNELIIGDINKGVEKITEKKLQELEEQSAIEVQRNKMKLTITSSIEVKRKTIDKKTIKMKKAYAINLDGETEQEWDSKNGTCVYDFIIWRYGNKKGCKKICNMEQLDTLFSKYKIDDITYECNNPREEGVCVYQLINFCDAVGVRMYAMDENSLVIHSYEPARINKDLTPLIFRIMNNHFYAIIDKAKSICMMGKNKTSLQHEKKKNETKEELDIVIIDDNNSINIENNLRIANMVNVMMNENTQVFPFNNMRFNENGLSSFTLNNKKYVFEEDDTIKNAKEICKLNDKPYTGESTFSILLNTLDELKYTNKSICNPAVYKSLTAEGVKDRTHYGMTTTQYNRDDLQNMINDKKAICADIAKCYTSCLENAYDNWIIYDFNDEWTTYDGNLKTGLYFVETNDMTLLHGSNIYSNKIVELALNEGIELNITKQLIPRTTLPSDYYHNLLNQIDTICKGDKNLKKSLTNIITGFLGKHQTYQYYPKLTTDIETIWNDFNTPEYHQHQTFMIKEGDYYLYGYKVPVQLSDINIPMYIQILDWSNIRLYNMIKQSKGTCVFRKTDCAVIINGSLEYGTNNGDYRISELPNVCGKMRPVEERNINSDIVEPSPWVLYPNITSSDQIDEVYNILSQKRAFLNVSRAGTGKTYNALQIEKKFYQQYGDSAKVIKLAFTNKACLSMGGTTIHKFLKIDKDGKFDMSWLKSLRNYNLLFIIDEISMIGKFLWRRLVELKKYLGKNVFFMLLGDYRQAPPVEDREEETNYFDSSAVKYLANNNKVEFIIRQRYDELLWDFAEDVYEREYTDYSKVRTITNYMASDLVNTTNICYFNNTRKYINGIVNAYVANMTSDKYYLEYVEDKKETKTQQQNAFLYAGCPIIAFVNNRKLDIINNETYKIKEIDEFNIVAVSNRIGCEGEVIEHIVEINTDDFHNYFLLNYCSTTHKQQGATIDNDIVIFDYESMSRELKYTAITRVKKLSQITIVQ